MFVFLILLDGDIIEDGNQCSSNPCKNGGECINGAQYTCVCVDGFTGADCETSMWSKRHTLDITM